MGDFDNLVRLANEHAERTKQDMEWETGRNSYSSGYWRCDKKVSGVLRARATKALDFLARHAGRNSMWFETAHASYVNGGEKQSLASGVRSVGDFLSEWADQVEAGNIQPYSVELVGVQEVAATDLMEQVRQLNSDSSIHPAAPIVLAGAALEVALRSLVEDRELSYKGNGTLGKYADVLRTAEVISKQERKDIEQVTGLRNQAAHGNHEPLSPKRADLMEQQVNLLLVRIRELMESAI